MTSVPESKLVNRVREVRANCGRSREDLAKQVGVTRQTIGLIESGRVSPSTTISLRLAKALNCPIDALFWEEDAPPTVEARLAGEWPAPDNPQGPRESLYPRKSAQAEPIAWKAYLSEIDGERVARPAYIQHAPVLYTPVHGMIRSESRSEHSSDARSEACPAGSASGRTTRGSRHVEVELLQPQGRINQTVFISGCDLGLGLLSAYVRQSSATCQGIWFNVPNQQALAELRDRATHIAALHYAPGDGDSWASEIPDDCDVYRLASAELGWIVRRGNPLGFRDASDLASGRLRLINRPGGSGARNLLDRQLRGADVSQQAIPGYSALASGHLAVADAVYTGLADIGVGHSSAAALYGLDFIPIQAETCSLVVPRHAYRHNAVQTVLETLHSSAFQSELLASGPYDVQGMGDKAKR